MTVAELITELQAIPGHFEVFLSKDSEGNGFKPFEGLNSDQIYDSEEEEMYSTGWDWREAGFSSEKEWENFKDNTLNCCVLYPE